MLSVKLLGSQGNAASFRWRQGFAALGRPRKSRDGPRVMTRDKRKPAGPQASTWPAKEILAGSAGHRGHRDITRPEVIRTRRTNYRKSGPCRLLVPKRGSPVTGRSVQLFSLSRRSWQERSILSGGCPGADVTAAVTEGTYERKPQTNKGEPQGLTVNVPSA